MRDERDGGETRGSRARSGQRRRTLGRRGAGLGAACQPAGGVRLVKGSHIVVARLYDHDRCYIFQNADRRIFFAIPYERDFTLIGTTDIDYHGDPADPAASRDEIDYLLRGGERVFPRARHARDAVVWTYSGVRPLYDDGASSAQAATRDYVLKLDAPAGEPALLSVFGGKITTYRRLAEAGARDAGDRLPRRPAGAGPDGALAGRGLRRSTASSRISRRLAGRYPVPRRGRICDGSSAPTARRVEEMLQGRASTADLGRVFGADLTEAEVRYLAEREWAETAEDVRLAAQQARPALRPRPKIADARRSSWLAPARPRSAA